MKARQSSVYRKVETLRDDILCPLVDRLPGTLSMQCIGQQVILDVMDAIFQLGLAWKATKGEPRLRLLKLAQDRLDDISSNVLALRQRTKRFDKDKDEGKKPARIITEKQYALFLQEMALITADLDAWMSSNAAAMLKSQTATPSD